MIIYDWEKSIVGAARTWPTEGPVYEFFKFWTDYHESRWLLLAFLIILAFWIGWKKLIIPSGLIIVVFTLADLASRRLFKNFIMRPRPNFVDVACSSSKCWGFVSSHSANITAAAVIICLYDKRNVYWALPVVLFVCFSRIYLIDHFPLDVLGGMVLGSFLSFALWRFYQTQFVQKIVSNLIRKLKY